MTWLVLPAERIGGCHGEWALVDTTKPPTARVRATFVDWAEAQAVETLLGQTAEQLAGVSAPSQIGARLRYEAERLRDAEPFG